MKLVSQAKQEEKMLFSQKVLSEQLNADTLESRSIKKKNIHTKTVAAHFEPTEILKH